MIKAVKDLGVDYPVALDNDYAIWKGFNNEYWPAHYFIDTQGQIRHHHFGEGEYEQSEDVIRQLLTEAGHKNLPGGYVQPGAPRCGSRRLGRRAAFAGDLCRLCPRGKLRRWPGRP